MPRIHGNARHFWIDFSIRGDMIAVFKEQEGKHMSFGVLVGIAIVVGLILTVGFLSGRRVKDSADFLSGSGKAGTFLVAGAIMGSLVGSQATMGTAQLSFQFGFSGWWFTLGCCFGCLVLGFVYSPKLRKSGCITELAIITGEYGPASGALSSVLCSIGIFISVFSQVIACAGLLSTLFPGTPLWAGALLSAIFMGLYVIFGGAWGAGMGGIVKLLLLCGVSFLGLFFILYRSQGPAGLWNDLKELLAGTSLGMIRREATGAPNISDTDALKAQFLSVVARGVVKDLSSGISLLLGVLCTQSYAQAIWSGKSDQSARRGALISAVAAPFIGLCGVAVGLFMRSHYMLRAEAEALMAAGKALPDLPILETTIRTMPTFALDHFPPLVAGVILGTLLITAVSGGAGLSFGMATILTRDILKRLSHRWDDPKQELRAVRICIGGVLLAAVAVTVSLPDSLINDFGFLSMGFRASVLFLPMTAALWLPGRVDDRCILLSMILSPCADILAKLLSLPGDPLLWGMAVSLLCCTVGWIRGKRKGA